ncbi:adenylate kinase 4, mitochondrial isoform X2 [Stigmatopora argus]
MQTSHLSPSEIQIDNFDYKAVMLIHAKPNLQSTTSGNQTHTAHTEVRQKNHCTLGWPFHTFYGFPRTLTQAQSLNNMYQLDLVLSLNIPFETLKDRLSDRWIHPGSGRVYNMGFNPPRVQGEDDITGEPLIQHDDDKPEALMSRLRHYKDVAKPVIELYKSQGILHSFSGTETDRIWPYINSLLTTKMQSPDAHQSQAP